MMLTSVTSLYVVVAALLIIKRPFLAAIAAQAPSKASAQSSASGRRPARRPRRSAVVRAMLNKPFATARHAEQRSDLRVRGSVGSGICSDCAAVGLVGLRAGFCSAVAFFVNFVGFFLLAVFFTFAGAAASSALAKVREEAKTLAHMATAMRNAAKRAETAAGRRRSLRAGGEREED